MTLALGVGAAASVAHPTVAYAALAQALVVAAESHIGSEAARAWAVQQAGQLLSMAAVAAAPAAAPLVPTPVPARSRLVLDEEHWEVRHRDLALRITLAQYRLLGALIRAETHTVPTRHLALVMFGSAHRETERVAAHVRRLRRRLVEEHVDCCSLDTVRGVGYRLTWTS
ncbi:winged helix-turn-helix domain-containing protein [Nocardioides KLBMP 9356]|uniref:Winged helix-turn-helix domain-containing protein n=1 Tax=Nocardioides potassii TaxID=2911371 RepID=A0ABS9H8U9_9ACTN|nr:winged helix-turn-helix domain-containing protein [Nocardioides potassii]MCF6376448.1 winged helix-turn-helix domain-containing protein [Nocardioides potassii]